MTVADLKNIHARLMREKDDKFVRPTHRAWTENYCSGCGILYNRQDPGTTEHYHSIECREFYKTVSKVRKVKDKFPDKVIVEPLDEDIVILKKMISSGKLEFTTKDISFIMKKTIHCTMKWLDMMVEVGVIEKTQLKCHGTLNMFMWKLTMHPSILKLKNKGTMK